MENDSAPPAPDDVLPLAIVTAHGEIASEARMNTKAHHKSLESGELWVTDENGRILPWRASRRSRTVTLKAGSTFYLAVLDDSTVDLDSATTSERLVDVEVRAPATLQRLAALIQQRRESLPEGSYTTYLFREGVQKIRKKVGEEAIELITATEKANATGEAADLLYHLLVLLTELGIPLEAVLAELDQRDN